MTDRGFRVSFDRNQFPIPVINQLPAADATIWANRAGNLRIIRSRSHCVRFFRHRLHAGAIFALANLPYERPFRKQRAHVGNSVLRSRGELQSLESLIVQPAKPAKNKRG
jgi:hypothetical protein